MKPQLRIVSGALAGHTEVFSKPEIRIGRHPDSELALDSDRDLKASARHATISHRDGAWYVRDEDSRNGTFVNGHRITAETKLDDTDQIGIGGEGGPVIEVRLVPNGTPNGVLARAKAQAPPPTQHGGARTPQARAPQRPTTPAVSRRGSTTERIRVEVGKQTKVLRRAIVGLVIVLIAGAGAAFVITRRQALVREQEISAIQARTDSMLREAEAATQALQGQVAGLASRLQQSQNEVIALQQRLASATDVDEIEALKDELAAATTTLSYQQSAAQVDYRAIAEANRYAVALLWVRFPNGEVFNGTAFAVDEDGILITNRHVVYGENDDRRPVEIAVKFEESRQVWQADLVGVSDDADVAALKVSIRGGVPTVRGLNTNLDDISQGDPVAVIGFPLGTDLPLSGAGTSVARTSFTAGSVSRVLPDRIQIDGYGVQGQSGSPIFDRRGQVIAVLYGGQAGTSGRIVFGAPASSIAALLASIR